MDCASQRCTARGEGGVGAMAEAETAEGKGGGGVDVEGGSFWQAFGTAGEHEP